MSPGQQRLTLRQGLVPICLLAGILSGWSAAPEITGPARLDYSSFRIINERNIFNASRSGWAAPDPREERRPSRVEAFTLVGTMAYRKGPFAFFDGTSSEYRKVLPPGGTIATYKVAEITNSSVRLETDTNQFELKVGAQLRREDEGPWQMVEQAPAFVSVGGRDDSSRGDARGFDRSRGDFRGNDSRRGDFRGNDSRRGDSRSNDFRRGDPRSSDARSTSSIEPARSSSSAPASTAPKLSSEQEAEILKRLMQQREQETK